MEDSLKQSAVNWTVVRPPRLTMDKLKGKYRFAVNEWLPSCTSISRADLAHFILNHLDDSSIYKSIVEVSY
jgi:putative NADH-flavin reductase